MQEEDDRDDDMVQCAIDAAATASVCRLSNCGLEKIPSSVFTLLHLRTLDVSANMLRSVSNEIGGLQSLTCLALNHNQLGKLPKEMWRLYSLRKLYLNNNHLKTLPDGVKHLTSLRLLDASFNKLAGSLTPAVCQCVSLTDLRLRGNQLVDIPIAFGAMTQLKSLSLEGNRLTEPPKPVVRRGASAVVAFFSEKLAAVEEAKRQKSEERSMRKRRTFDGTTAEALDRVRDLEAKLADVESRLAAEQAARAQAEAEIRKVRQSQARKPHGRKRGSWMGNEARHKAEASKRVRSRQSVSEVSADVYEGGASDELPYGLGMDLGATTSNSGGSWGRDDVQQSDASYLQTQPNQPPQPYQLDQPQPESTSLEVSPRRMKPGPSPRRPMAMPVMGSVSTVAAAIGGGRREGDFEWEIAREDIVLKRRLGRGGYGEVHKGVWRGTDVAVKRLFLDDSKDTRWMMKLRNEIDVLCRMRHPNIVLFMGACTRNMEEPLIVTEYLTGGSLADILTDDTVDLDYPLRLEMAVEVAKGMCYLHHCRPIIIHRDLKTDNLLVDDNWHIKIADFGLSKVKDETFARSTCGTTGYVAPEILKNQPYTEKVDVYSYGVVLWELWTRKIPYDGMPTMAVVRQIDEGETLSLPDDCPQDYRNLMQLCWEQEPIDRPSFDEVLVELKQILERLSD